jgi:hypothetical protein
MREEHSLVGKDPIIRLLRLRCMNLWLKNKKSCSDENGSDNTINGSEVSDLEADLIKEKSYS